MPESIAAYVRSMSEESQPKLFAVSGLVDEDNVFDFFKTGDPLPVNVASHRSNIGEAMMEIRGLTRRSHRDDPRLDKISGFIDVSQLTIPLDRWPHIGVMMRAFNGFLKYSLGDTPIKGEYMANIYIN